jgi:hypothetical protein
VVASLNATFDATQSESRLGLPGVTLLIPAGNPFSPFATTVALDRYATALGPLTQDRDSWNARLGGGLNKDLSGWRLSLTGAFARRQPHPQRRRAQRDGASGAAERPLADLQPVR